MAVRECMMATVTIGFAHAVYNKGLMYLRRRSEAEANPPMPDKLMVTGHYLTTDYDLTIINPLEPSHTPERRGLSASAGTKKGIRFPLLYLKGDSFDSLDDPLL